MFSGDRLRVGYVPEHFSTPLHFAQLYYNLDADLIAFPSGTGHMITALQSNDIDIGIGLTEAWISGLGKAHLETRDAGYKLVGKYTESPLCWALSIGAQRADIGTVEALRGQKLGVSRIGSGSYVMGFVLADHHGWLEQKADAPFEVVPLQTFDKLRAAVNDKTADFFMWEYFTSKRYYDNGEIKKIGQIYTPWPAWQIVSKPGLVGTSQLEDFFRKIDQGIDHFNRHQEEAVQYISTQLDYSTEDAQEWLKTVHFPNDVRGVRQRTVQDVVSTLQKAGVLDSSLGGNAVSGMVAIPSVN